MRAVAFVVVQVVIGAVGREAVVGADRVTAVGAIAVVVVGVRLVGLVVVVGGGELVGRVVGVRAGVAVAAVGEGKLGDTAARVVGVAVAGEGGLALAVGKAGEARGVVEGIGRFGYELRAGQVVVDGPMGVFTPFMRGGARRRSGRGTPAPEGVFSYPFSRGKKVPHEWWVSPASRATLGRAAGAS